MAKPRKKLTREQWDELNQQFEKTPEPGESHTEPGQHMLLIAVLNGLGFYPTSRSDALKIADSLLSAGWEEVDEEAE